MSYKLLIMGVHPDDDVFCVCNLILQNRQVVTFGISRNTNFKYLSHCSSLVLDCSHTRYRIAGFYHEH